MDTNIICQLFTFLLDTNVIWQLGETTQSHPVQLYLWCRRVHLENHVWVLIYQRSKWWTILSMSISNSNYVPDIEKPGWKFGYQKDIIVIIVNVHLFCTHQNLCVLEPLFLLFQFCNLGNGRDSLGSKTSDSVRHWWGSDVWVMWVDFQLVSDFLLDLPWQLSTTDGVKHIISLQGSQTTIEFSLFMFNPDKKVSVDWF